MKVGVSTASLFMRKNNEEALPFLDELGVHTAEIFLTSFSEYEKPFAQMLASKKGNVDVNSVHILNTQFEPQLFNTHPRVQGDAFYWLDKVLQSIQILGAPYYTFHGASRVKRSSRSGINDDFVAIKRGFEKIIAACEKYGVTLCLENGEWPTYTRGGLFSKINDDLPKLRTVLDIKQARISEYPYEAYIDEMGERLAYVHISDTDTKGKMCLPGKGTFDFDTLVRRLKDVGFDGAFLIEVYTDNYGDEKELKKSCDYIDEILYKYGVKK